MREAMTDNARELSLGEMRQICEQEVIKLHTGRYDTAQSRMEPLNVRLGCHATRFGYPQNLMGRGVQRSDIPAQQDADVSIRWSNAVRGALWCEARRFAFARIRSAVRHCRVEGTFEKA